GDLDHPIYLMRTDTTIPLLAEVAVIAKELVTLWEVFFDNSIEKTVPIETVLSLKMAVIMDMIYREKPWIRFSAASACIPVPGIHCIPETFHIPLIFGDDGNLVSLIREFIKFLVSFGMTLRIQMPRLPCLLSIFFAP